MVGEEFVPHTLQTSVKFGEFEEPYLRKFLTVISFKFSNFTDYFKALFPAMWTDFSQLVHFKS